MIVGYARVSTADQNLELQIDALTMAGCEKIFEEKESARKNGADRVQLSACLAAIRSGDVLIVWKLDRLARSLKDLVDLVGKIESAGAEFKCLTQPVDTTTASGRLVFAIFAAIAEFEHDLIVERTKAGLASARRRGNHGGRKPKLRTDQAAAVLNLSHQYTNRALSKIFGVSVTTIKRQLKIARSNENGK
jgi:DNA invertase Pin-like site-specific DNA recombinase